MLSTNSHSVVLADKFQHYNDKGLCSLFWVNSTNTMLLKILTSVPHQWLKIVPNKWLLNICCKQFLNLELGRKIYIFWVNATITLHTLSALVWVFINCRLLMKYIHTHTYICTYFVSVCILLIFQPAFLSFLSCRLCRRSQMASIYKMLRFVKVTALNESKYKPCSVITCV